MPEIAPGRLVRYADGIPLSDVVCPPYDVIDEAGRAALEAKSPHNFVRLILPREKEHTRALLDAWLASGVLVREGDPSILAIEQVFVDPVSGATRVRRGIQALLKLSPFSEGKVLPHERTLSGPKADRLSLMTAVGAHLSPIFVLYPDARNEALAVLGDVFSRPPDGEAEAAGATHRVWRLRDARLIAAVAEVLGSRTGYIADGHHRYETALEYLRRAREAGTATPAAEYIPAFLCSLSDPGLVVFPTHRLLHSTGITLDALLPRLEGLFEVSPLPSGEALLPAIREAGVHAFGVLEPSGRAVLLRWTPDAMSGPLGQLDVSALHEVLFERVLGLSRESQERQENLRYVKDGNEAVRRTLAGEAELAFLLNATPTEQVRAVAESGAVMPQKSTYFFPKIIDGLGLQLLGG